jgi:hypothetical protein
VVELELKTTRIRIGPINGWEYIQEAMDELSALKKKPKIILIHGFSYLEYDVKQLGVGA